MPDWLDNALKIAALVAVAAAALQYQLLKNARETNTQLRDDLKDMDRRLELLEKDKETASERVLTLTAENNVLRSALGAEKVISDMEARLDAKAQERHEQHENAATARTERLARLLEEIRDRGAA